MFQWSWRFRVMSDLKINNITDRTGGSGPVIAGVSTVSSTGAFIIPVGSTEMRGGRGRVVCHSAQPSPGTLTLEKIEIATTGNATDFGDTTVSRANAAGCASATRGFFMGGQPGASPYYVTNIDYVIISSSGGANDFGDLTQAGNDSIDARRGAACGSNDSTRGLIAGGNTPGDGGARKEIEFITMASTGDSSDFGELTQERFDFGNSGCANGTRAVWAGGYSQTTPAATFFSTIDYVNVQSRGDAIHFGELSATRGRTGETSNTTRALVGVGGGPAPNSKQNQIEYITMSTLGNAQDFGDLVDSMMQPGGCASSTRGVFCGGNGTPSSTNIIQYVTIASTGNAIDFGDTTIAAYNRHGSSDSHGGLG